MWPFFSFFFLNLNRIEVWDHLSENPYWCHQTTNETTWSVPPDVKPSGWRPSKDPVVHANMEQKYYDEMGIINPNKIVPRIMKEDRILDEENGWYEGKSISSKLELSLLYLKNIQTSLF